MVCTRVYSSSFIPSGARSHHEGFHHAQGSCQFLNRRNPWKHPTVGRSWLVMTGSPGSVEQLGDEPISPEKLIMDYISSPETPSDAPLSIDSLRREGRSDVLNALVKLGGSVVVADQLDLDASMFISSGTINTSPFPPFNNPETGAAITLGHNLERRLETSKATLTTSRENDGKQMSRTESDVAPRRKDSDDVPTAEELLRQRRESEQRLQQKVPLVVSSDEAFTLTADIRIGFILLAATAAVGFGRASVDTVDNSVIAACQALATGLLAAHVLLAFYVARVLAPRRKRGPVLWFVKTLFGGPLAVRALRSLPVNSSK